MPRYVLTPEGVFLVEQYQDAPTFASFLPGIAGPWGRPLWVFYVNRGQAIASFGQGDKNHPLLEFHPANQAYRLTATHGFRTFVKRAAAGRTSAYEPFAARNGVAYPGTRQRLRISAQAVALEEENPHVGLTTRVRYFTLVNAPVAALAREVTLRNTSRAAVTLEVLDGVPALVPCGLTDWFLKYMSHTITAWVGTRLQPRTGTALFQLVTEPHDRPDVVPVTQAHFYQGWRADGRRAAPLHPVVDPALVFGVRDDLAVPARFFDTPRWRAPSAQAAQQRLPSAFGHTVCRLRPGAAATLRSLYGHAADAAALAAFQRAAVRPGYFERQTAAGAALIAQIQDRALTVSNETRFDRYCGQTFLDNVLRGGLPVPLPSPAGRGRRCYLYGRKHGDLERDYNQFLLPSTPWSQGDANYRDLNQNRRSDVWSDPDVGDANLKTFLNLIQADGYNPLVCRGARFTLRRAATRWPHLRALLGRAAYDAMIAATRRPFTPGELWGRLMAPPLRLNRRRARRCLTLILGAAEAHEEAEHGEGFWVDHWTYNLDLIESYLAVYPERLRRLLLEDRSFTFYDNAMVAAPRAARYVLHQERVRQAGAVIQDEAKAALIASRAVQPHLMRTRRGRGPVYRTTLLTKLLCVLANKLATLDPCGVGVEMEAEKPGWYDALNGLPGLCGSSTPETLTLARLVRWLREAQRTLGIGPAARLRLPAELADFLATLQQALTICLASRRADRHLRYWRASAEAKEVYRRAARFGYGGQERSWDGVALEAFLAVAERQLAQGIARAYDRRTGLPHTYFVNEVTRYARLPRRNGTTVYVRPTAFRQRPLPLFLEGAVHAMRLLDAAAARPLHRAVERSALYDRRLRMYRVCAPLTGQPLALGRATAFPPGYLEHASIWLHMEYKYLLELLRCGLHDEFARALRSVLVPFQRPAVYGRSPLEHVSFIVSSLHPDAGQRGRGHYARLSGATAEWLQLWWWMAVGRRPFQQDGRGRLVLRLDPSLPGWLFTERPVTRAYYDRQGRRRTLRLPRGSYAMAMFGGALLVYHNARRQPTYGPRPARPVRMVCTNVEGRRITVSGETLPPPYARQVREGAIRRVDVELAARESRTRQ